MPTSGICADGLRITAFTSHTLWIENSFNAASDCNRIRGR